MKFKYPTCKKCGTEINPNIWDSCEKYYLADDDVLCLECFIEWVEDKLRESPEEVAFALGVDVVEVGE